MVDANRQPLKGTVEIDATSIGGEQLGLRGGRQLAGRKALMVAVAVEVRSRGSGRVRAEVISDASAATLSHFIVANIEQGSTVLPDGHSGHQGREDVAAHAHRAISTLKAWLLGTHRGVGADQIPVYLDEFVFRDRTAGVRRWPASRRCSASACTVSRRPVRRSSECRQSLELPG